MTIDSKHTYSEEHEQLRAGLVYRNQDLFQPVLLYIDQIYSMINTYIVRKDYQVIRNGLNAIVSIVYKYIDVRQGTFFHSMLFAVSAGGDVDLSHDPFLNDVLEKMSALQRIASANKDLELSKDILDCLSKIAKKCADIKYRTKVAGELPHCNLVVQYIHQNIQDSLSTGLLDMGISGATTLRDVGVFLIAKNGSIGIRIVIKDLSQIAMNGIARPNATFLISYPMQAFSFFLRAFVFSKAYYDKYLPESIFEEVQGLVDLYLKIKVNALDLLNMELQSSFGPFIDLSSKSAVPYIFSEAYNEVINDKLSIDERNKIVDRVIDLSDQFWRFYDALSKLAAKKESFLIYFIGVGSHHVAKMLAHFCQIDLLNEEQKKYLKENIKRIISIYWKLYNYHEKITASYDIQMLDDLLELGDMLYSFNLGDEFRYVIESFVAIADLFLEKQENKYGFDPIRILQKGAYLCILANNPEVDKKFLERIKVSFWPKYIEKYPKNKEILYNELLKLDPMEKRLNRWSHFYEDSLIAKMDEQRIRSFVLFLKESLG